MSPIAAMDGRRLHRLLATRHSPMAFDPAHVATAAQVESLLEAARWAPSAGNSQPWAFIVGLRGDDVHRRLVSHLTASSAAWAPDAGILIANLAHRLVEGTDWEYSEFALYDLGQSVAHLTVQARALGLAVRQFRAFDRAAVEREFAVPAHWEVTTLAAVGRAPDRRTTAGAAPPRRTRRPAAELVWTSAATEDVGRHPDVPGADRLTCTMPRLGPALGESSDR